MSILTQSQDYQELRVCKWRADSRGVEEEVQQGKGKGEGYEEYIEVYGYDLWYELPDYSWSFH